MYIGKRSNSGADGRQYLAWNTEYLITTLPFHMNNKRFLCMPLTKESIVVHMKRKSCHQRRERAFIPPANKCNVAVLRVW